MAKDDHIHVFLHQADKATKARLVPSTAFSPSSPKVHTYIRPEDTIENENISHLNLKNGNMNAHAGTSHLGTCLQTNNGLLASWAIERPTDENRPSFHNPTFPVSRIALKRNSSCDLEKSPERCTEKLIATKPRK